MRRLPKKTFLLAWLLAISTSLVRAQAPPSQPRTDNLVQVKIHSPGLEKNKLGDPADQKVLIYLPPSYSTSPGRKFATLYLLHGFTGTPELWTDGRFQSMNIAASMDQLIASGLAREMIVVMPNGNNKYLGSFYTNSVVSGNWEDFIVQDVVSYVDSHYRTLASAASRGIAGHSMGGYGSIMLAMKHPEVFGAVYAMSPCCVGMKADFTSENPAWHSAIAAQSGGELSLAPHNRDEFFTIAFIASGAAWSPNPQHGPVYVDLPYREEGKGLAVSEPVFERWKEHMPLYAAARYKENLLQLHGICIEYGSQDNFTHIPITVRMFSKELSRLGVPHTLVSFEGDHTGRIRERFETGVAPFFSRILETGEAKAHIANAK